MIKHFLFTFFIGSTFLLTGCVPSEYNSEYSETVQIELQKSNQNDIDIIHNNNKIANCLISITTYQEWIIDKDKFKIKDIGNIVSWYPDEKWIDISTYSIFNIMKDRIKRASELQCDEITFYNLDIYKDNNGLNIDKTITEQYTHDLIDEAHQLNLEVGAFDNETSDDYYLEYYFDFILY